MANFAGSYHPASLDDCFAIIDDRVKKYNYDKIFLATEDTNFLEKMINKFPNMVIAVSQERHKVEEFTNEKYISQRYLLLKKETMNNLTKKMTYEERNI